MDTTLLMQQLDSEEVKIEEKIHHLREYVYHMLGLNNSSEYYHEHGAFLARYLAGFVDRIFELFEDIAYIVFDPLHIIHIIQSFAKAIFLHPIQTFKTVAVVLIKKHTTPYGLGILTAEAFILTLSAAAVAKVGALAAEATSDSVLAAETVEVAATEGAAVEEVAEATHGIMHSFEDYEEIFRQIRGNPHEIIHHAQNTLRTGQSTSFFAGVKHFLGMQ